MVWFALVFIAMWFAIVTAAALLGGWYWLARAHPMPHGVVGRRFFFTTIAIRGGYLPVSYGGIVVVNVGEKGLALNLIFLFRPLLHPPFFLPWGEVADCALQESRRRATVTVRTEHPDYELQFRGVAAAAIYRAYNQSRHAKTNSAGG